jgi:hypothetical protein
LQLHPWLICLDQDYAESSAAMMLLSQILWSIGVDRAQFVCAIPTVNQDGLSCNALQKQVHPAFMLSWGVTHAREASSLPHLALPWTLDVCLAQPLLKQQVMYELYRFMHLSEA